MSRRQLVLLWATVLATALLAACGDDERGGGGGGGSGGVGGFAGVGGDGSGGFAGVAGDGSGGFAGVGGDGSGGFAGVGGDGSGGFAGVGGDGSGGFAGVGGDGSGGVGGVGGSGGTGGASGTGGVGGTGGGSPPIIHGPEPTATSAGSNGSYTVANYTSGFARPPASFSAATIYHPSTAAGPLSMVVICPGWTATQSSIAGWGPFLASHGIVTMTIDTGTTGDSVVQRSVQLMDALTSLKAENTRAGSPLQGKLALDRAGLMGWSMGGGGTWISTNNNPDLRTGVSLAGHIATAGGAGTVPMIQVPSFLCAGQTDTLILGGAMSQPVYDAIPATTPKMLYEIAGQGHSVCNTPTTNNGQTGRLILSWQKVFLEGDERYRQFLLQTPTGTSDFRTNLN